MNSNSAALRPALFAAVIAIVPASALAAGVYIPEEGAGVLARGGTSIGVADTAYGLEFNPAGMALVDGLDVRLDINLTNPTETFTGTRTGGGTNYNTVSNSGGISPTPYVAAVYGFHVPVVGRFAVGLGLWAPPGVLSYKFPNPSSFPSSTDSGTIAEATPQRYNNISQGTVVLYPAAGLAWQPLQWFSLGATLQYVYSTVDLQTSLVGATALAGTMKPDSTSGDILAHLKVQNKTGEFTYTVGATITPLKGLVPKEFDDLILGASFTPTLPIASTGTLNLTLGSDLSSVATICGPGATKTNCPSPSASLSIVLPPVARAGAAYRWKRLQGSAEFHWEGWSFNKQFAVGTNAQSSLFGGAPAPTAVPPIVNDWVNSVGGRVGFSYDFLQPAENGFLLQGAIGGLFESNAIPSANQTIPYITGNIEGGSLGVSAAWHGFGIVVSGMLYAPQSFTVTDSKVALPVGIGTAMDTIGNGTYTTNFWQLGFGIFYRGLGSS